MDYRTLVYFVLLQCSINALPYERDSHESGDIVVHFGDDDQHIILDDQEQHKIFELDENIEDEDKEIFINEEQNQETGLEANIENEDTEILLDDQQKEKTDFEKNTKDEDKEILLDFDQEQETLQLGKNTEDEDKKIFLDNNTFVVEQKVLEKKVVTDKPKPGNYAVTELVIDVPDDRTKGPIIANFSISKPINIASTKVPTAGFDKDNSNEGHKNTASNGSEGNKVVDPDENEDGTGKKNYISILHVKAEYDDKTDKTNKNKIDSSDFDFVNVPHISGIKEYFNGIKQGIVNGFNSIIHKNSNTEESHTHNRETEPFSFFNKIQRKGSDFAQKIHNHIFGDHEQNHF